MHERNFSRLLLISAQACVVFLRSCVGMFREVGPVNVIIIGLVRNLLILFFLSGNHMTLRNTIFGLSEANSYSRVM